MIYGFFLPSNYFVKKDNKTESDFRRPIVVPFLRTGT